MPIPNPQNGYIPYVGERVRIIGACHPRCLGKVVEVTAIYQHKTMDSDEWFFEEKHIGACPNPNECDGELCGKTAVHGGGVIGGLEHVGDDTPIDTF